MKQYNIKFNTPASLDHNGWERQSFPIGNSYMGMCVFGDPNKERLQFNEKSLWKGGPTKNRSNYNGGNVEGSYTYMKQIQQALKENNQKAVLKLKDKLIGVKDDYGCYLNFGDIIVETKHSNYSNYSRWLDLNNAVCHVKYDNNGSNYIREHFASFKDRVIVSKFASNRKDLSINISLNVAQKGCEIKVENNFIIGHGFLQDNEMEYYCKCAIESDGSLENGQDFIGITNASYVVIVLDGGTNYKNVYPNYRGDSPIERVNNNILNALKLGYDKLLERHIQDYSKLFNACDFNVVKNETSIETPVLLTKISKDTESAKQLQELLFQFGRYFIIGSSRGDDLPANLQGVWNDSNNPPWGSDYHLNVNLQMCYWHVYNTGLQECAVPMIKYMQSLREPGRKTARIYHNIESTKENPENGWVCHTQNTVFGLTSPGWAFYWGWSPAASSWMMQNCIDYYKYTLDKDFLVKEIYPMLKENAKFWLQNLVYDEKQDRYVSSPSFSPEHGPISTGNTYEQELIWQLFKDTIYAANEVGGEEDFIEEIKKVQSKLNPLGVGKWGQVKEWYEEDEWFNTLSFKKLKYKRHGCQNGHRHMSHLLGLYPGDGITRETKELFAASKVSILDRGMGSKFNNGSGWSKVNKMSLWARLKEGDNAYAQMMNFMSNNLANNLWDLHPPFQMDGNCGYTAAVCEMLLYSGEEYIELLPALPKEWNSGNVSGFCAKGGYVFDFDWENGNIKHVVCKSRSNNKCKLYINEHLLSLYSNNKIGDVVEVEVDEYVK